MGHKISKEQIDPGVKDHIMSFVGDVADLETEVNTDIISAVNSLMVDRVDNVENMGKLANAIGEPVTANHSVDEVVEGHKPVGVAPYLLVRGMKDVGAVAVHVDPVLFLGVDVPGDVAAPVDHSAGCALLLHFPCEHSAVKSCADNEIIILHDILSFPVSYPAKPPRCPAHAAPE